jgi:hypothetical protein
MSNLRKTTEKQLSKIIAEECESYYSNLPKHHVDGQPWGGSIEDLAIAQSSTWGHGSIANEKQWNDQIKKSRNLSLGKDKLSLKLTENELRYIIHNVLGEYKKV